jgi:D-sedoheptulose 7-phosphate isomerase
LGRAGKTGNLLMSDDMNIDLLKSEIEASIKVKQQLLEDESLLGQILDISKSCVDSLRVGGKMIFCGNGGSFADAQHLSAEFTSRFLFDRPALASIALGTNNSGLTAMGNDYGYENIFSRELEALGKPEDILIGITTSGNSPNIIKGVDAAKKIGITTFVLTGQSGGKLKDLADCVHMPSNDTARIQECHILVGHIICGFVEKVMFRDYSN